jgi:hypothetical protein
MISRKVSIILFFTLFNLINTKIKAQLFGGQIKTSKGIINTLSCSSATNTGVLISGLPASAVNCTVPYSGGNGGVHNGQIVNSTGVTGLTATLASGNFANGIGSLTYTITGTPSGIGTVSFVLNIGGQICTLNLISQSLVSQYPTGSVFCASGPTAIIDVTNPTTGKTWMDRNLGASKIADSLTDVNAYGDLYQWGRRSDGHQCRTSATTTVLSSSNQPSHGNFILVNTNPFDWRNPQNINLWQGVNGINNPCPIGYRLPTETEWDTERLSWNTSSPTGAFSSFLLLTVGGARLNNNGAIGGLNSSGFYWSSTTALISSWELSVTPTAQTQNNLTTRSYGMTVRCIKN